VELCPGPAPAAEVAVAPPDAAQRGLPVANDGFDPLRGIEPDGRIPYASRPQGLEHPERWRYLPEGRIKPGNVFERLFVTSFLAPYFFKSSDAGFGGGLALGDIDFRTQRRREAGALYGSYTTRNQASFGFFWRRWLHHIELPEGGILQEERSSVGGGISYNRTRTRRFFGIGPDTTQGDESRYTDSDFEVEASADVAYPDPGDDLVLSGGLRLEVHELSSGLGNDPDTKDAYPLLFDEAEGRDLFWISSGLRWDTRDSQRNPYHGWHVGALSEAAPVQSVHDAGGRVTVDGSKVFPLPGLFHRGGDRDEENPATDTLVFGLRTVFTWGNLPFFSRARLGGPDSLRGYVTGRFTDDASWFGRAEYRFWVLERGFGLTESVRFERVGLALFYEAGSVASGGLQLFDADVKHSFGLGLLAGIERALPFRADLAFSGEEFPSPRITAGLGLSF
jgi:hypothetical protein